MDHAQQEGQRVGRRKITDDPQKRAKAQAADLAVRSGQLSYRKTAKQHGVRLSTIQCVMQTLD